MTRPEHCFEMLLSRAAVVFDLLSRGGAGCLWNSVPLAIATSGQMRKQQQVFVDRIIVMEWFGLESTVKII